MMKKLIIFTLFTSIFSSAFAEDLTKCFKKEDSFDAAAPVAVLKVLNSDGSIVELAQANIKEAYDSEGVLLSDTADYKFSILENCKDIIPNYKEKFFVEILCDSSRMAVKSVPCNNMNSNPIPVESQNIYTGSEEICTSADCTSAPSDTNERIFKVMDRAVKVLNIPETEFSFDQQVFDLVTSGDTDQYNAGLSYLDSTVKQIETNQETSVGLGFSKTETYPLTAIIKGFQANMDAYNLEGIVA